MQVNTAQKSVTNSGLLALALSMLQLALPAMGITESFWIALPTTIAIIICVIFAIWKVTFKSYRPRIYLRLIISAGFVLLAILFLRNPLAKLNRKSNLPDNKPFITSQSQVNLSDKQDVAHPHPKAGEPILITHSADMGINRTTENLRQSKARVNVHIGTVRSVSQKGGVTAGYIGSISGASP